MKIKQLKHKDIPRIRKKLLKRQDGVCAICGQVPERPCLDHEHKKKIKGSGLVRGVLCSNCNVFLAKIENNCVRYGIKRSKLPFILKRSALYIRKNTTHYMHPSEKPKTRKLKKQSFNNLRKRYLEKYPKLPAALKQYPKSGTLIKPVKEAFELLCIEPDYYK